MEQVGWTPALAFYLEEADPGLAPGRVAWVGRGAGQVLCEGGPLAATWPVPLRLLPDDDEVDGPAVGDFCGVDPDSGRIGVLLPRRSRFVRGRASGSRAEQVIAANIDVAFLVAGLDRDFSPRRVERYLTLTRRSGARAVVVLNKADLCSPEAVAGRTREVERLAPEISVLAVSALDRGSLDDLRAELAPGVTGALLGSSGVGKSTLINQLLGEERLATAEVRAFDDRGRHTTTRRELLPIPGGGAVIDTPGLREVGVLGAREDLDAVFPEIAELAATCRFNDCQHETEPGCAVQAAAAAGELDPERLASYRRLVRELESARRRQSAFAQRAHERRTQGPYHEWLREIRRLKGDDIED